MSSEGSPPVFDGEDFAYWKIRMETYLEVIDEGVYGTTIVGFPEVEDKNKLSPMEK